MDYMLTYQDYEQAEDKLEFIKKLVRQYMDSEDYKIALEADQYEKQRNTTIMRYMKYLYNEAGQKVVDFTAANRRLASNYFHRLNTDRCAYSLGNGVSFANKETVKDKNGIEQTVDATKEMLGDKFDKLVYDAAYKALIHKISYTFWNLDHGIVFPATQFAPLWDEYTGKLRAGARFWSLDWSNKPVIIVLYTEEGYIKYQTKKGSKGMDIEEVQPLTAYKLTIQSNRVDGAEIIGESNYGTLPVIPLYGNKAHQSTLIGLQSKIDAYDLVQSGFADDLEEVQEIYWLVNGAMGMQTADLTRFRDQLKLHKIAVVDTDNGTVVPYKQEIPTEARTQFLNQIRASMYEDFAVLDVHTVAAGATNDHIDAGYQPMDEEADDFEYLIIEYIQQILALMGIENTPTFKRNKISNQKEQTEMVMLTANYLDDRTLLTLLPFLTVDQVESILIARDKEEARRLTTEGNENPEGEFQQEGQQEERREV